MSTPFRTATYRVIVKGYISKFYYLFRFIVFEVKFLAKMLLMKNSTFAIMLVNFTRSILLNKGIIRTKLDKELFRYV